MKNPIVSVICTNFNKAKWIEQALMSFLAQETNFEFEILVIDDASTDGSIEIIQKITNKNPEKIRFFRNEKNLGIAKTWKKICKKARGKYIARCDGDDFWISKEKLQKQFDLLECSKDSKWCNTEFRTEDEFGRVLFNKSFAEKFVEMPTNFTEMLILKGFTNASTWFIETELVKEIKGLKTDKMYLNDFFLTWEKSEDELKAVWDVADALRNLRERNISTKVFDSGLGISLFRDNSTRTRFSFASACNLLGLEVQDLDEGKSQVAHGETVRETANMISFMADIIGIRDDMYIGKGNAYMHEVADSVEAGHKDGVLEQRPTLVNLQCDIDHPTQCMADALHVIHEMGGIENLKGKKLAMTWAYSPSYGKPLSVPQGVIGLFTRLGMEVVLAHPEGYDVMKDVVDVAEKNAKESGGSFKVTNDMKEAFQGADIVYPKSWAPFAAMEKRTNLYGEGDTEGIKALEKELLAQNAQHKDWACTEEMMKLTKDGKALYMHCLPADITGVSCDEGEVDATVFDRYRDPLYKEASYKPYVIAAMILLEKFKDPAKVLEELEKRGQDRIFEA